MEVVRDSAEGRLKEIKFLQMERLRLPAEGNAAIFCCVWKWFENMQKEMARISAAKRMHRISAEKWEWFELMQGLLRVHADGSASSLHRENRWMIDPWHESTSREQKQIVNDGERNGEESREKRGRRSLWRRRGGEYAGIFHNRTTGLPIFFLLLPTTIRKPHCRLITPCFTRKSCLSNLRSPSPHTSPPIATPSFTLFVVTSSIVTAIFLPI